MRRLGALACIGFAGWLAGCGGGEGSDLLGEKALRECLARARIGGQPPRTSGAAGYAPVYLDTAPDFTAYSRDGGSVDVIVLGSSERARRTAAHVRGALKTLGVPASAVAARMVADRNAVVAFSEVPSSADRAAVRSCLASD